jgi:hypothetical protein
MDENTSAVILSIVVFALYVLLPLIPSILIYKMFPETKVTAEGEISNWKIKAGGAFAAYIVVVLLGGPLLSRTQGIIDGMAACTWTVHFPQVILKDENGQPVPSQHLIKTLDVKLVPDVITKTHQIVSVTIPSHGIKVPTSTLTFSIPNFGEEPVDLQSTHYKFEREGLRGIKFTEPIVIQKWPTDAAPPAGYQGQSPLANASPIAAVNPALIPNAPLSSKP